MRTRFAPAPSGELHVGNVRAALYNWAFARRHGGRFILRVEDTDRSRATDDAYMALQDILAWVGLHWDEGPGLGGPHGPYRQSERTEHYAAAAERLAASGAAYRCYCTPQELAERRAQASAAGRTPGYDGRCRALSGTQRADFEAEGRTWILRFAMPSGETTWTDLVRGPVTVRHEEVPDFAVTRSDGHPLYLLAAAVDDLDMAVTHVVRGEDLLAATPRQMALYAALGAERASWPAFGHLPLLVGSDNKPLSKRNGEVSLAWYRAAGFLPEALLNYLALLGWSDPQGREQFSLEELTEVFGFERVSHNPARFDPRKLEAINGDWIRRLEPAALAERLRPWLAAAGVEPDERVLAAAVPLLQERITRLDQAAGMLGYLFVPEDQFRVEDPEEVGPGAEPVLRAAHSALSELAEWHAEPIAQAMSVALVEQLGLKARKAYAPVRVAVTGRRVSLPLWESMELLGRDRTLSRLERAVARQPG